MELTDIHCHILPGVDDGADTMEEARKILRLEYRDGVRTIIATPHYREGMFEPAMKQVVKVYIQVREMAREMGMHLYLGCEYHTNSRMVKDLRRRRRPSMVGSSYVLTEFSGAHNYEKIRNQVYDLLTEGYQPILAHIERYPCLREDIRKVRELVDLGAYIQMNAGAILGESGNLTRRTCCTLSQATPMASNTAVPTWGRARNMYRKKWDIPTQRRSSARTLTIY